MKIIETVSVTVTYSIVEENGERSAEITFTDGKFTHCGSRTQKQLLSLDDWHFLGMVAQRIGELGKRKARP